MPHPSPYPIIFAGSKALGAIDASRVMAAGVGKFGSGVGPSGGQQGTAEPVTVTVTSTAEVGPAKPNPAVRAQFAEPGGTLSVAPLAAPDVPGKTILPLQEVPLANYEMVGEQGRGGIGIVRRARDQRLDREVAVKELQRDSHDARLRFEREMRTTAKLQHPGVVPVHEAGCWPDGSPFYTMKLVEGRSLKELIAEKRTLEERLSLLPNVLAVAETIAYAHSQRVIHRDLKPSNVIVGSYGETIVIDWGLAKHLDENSPALKFSDSPYRTQPDDGLTVNGQVLGTPAYMPPEQAQGVEVDGQADVYSIGALLYHVLSGRPPYRGTTSAEILAQLTDRPPRPLASIVPTTPADLAAIVGKAMDRDPSSRYSSAQLLVEDLRRFQTGQLVSAHRYSTKEVLARWLRRHRTAVTVAALAAAVLIVLGAFAIQQIVRERNVALEEKRVATGALSREQAAKKDAELRTDRLLVAEAEKLLSVDPSRSLALLAKHSDQSNKDVLRVAEQALARGPSEFVYRRAKSKVPVPFAVTPDGHFVAIAGDTFQVWDRLKHARILEHALDAPVFVVQISPDASSVATGHSDGTINLWNVSTGESTSLPSGHDTIYEIAFSPDGDRVAYGDKGGFVQLFDLLHHRSMHATTFPSYVDLLRFDADGRQLGLATGRGAIHFFDIATQSWTHASPDTGPVTFSELVNDGRAMATWTGHGVVICSFSGDCETKELGRHDGTVRFVAGSPSVLICTADGKISVLDYRAGTQKTLYSSDRSVTCGAVSQDGKYMIGGRQDGTVILTRLEDGFAFEYHGHTGNLRQMEFAGDRTISAITSAEDGSLRIWTAPILPSAGHSIDGTPLQYASFSPRDNVIVVRGTDTRVDFWRQDGRPDRTLTFDSRALRARFSPDEHQLYTSHASGTVRASNVETGESVVLAQLQGFAAGLEVSPTGRLVAASSSSGEILLWDSVQRTAVTLRGPEQPAYYMLFSPDERYLVSAGAADGEVRLWNLMVGTSEPLYKHGTEIRGLEWLRRGQSILTASDDGVIKEFDLNTRKSREFATVGAAVARFTASASGDRILAVDAAGQLRVWNSAGHLLFNASHVSFAAAHPTRSLIAIGYESGVLGWADPANPHVGSAILAHRGDVVFLSFSNDGSALVTAGLDGLAETWRLSDMSTTNLEDRFATFKNMEGAIGYEDSW